MRPASPRAVTTASGPTGSIPAAHPQAISTRSRPRADEIRTRCTQGKWPPRRTRGGCVGESCKSGLPLSAPLRRPRQAPRQGSQRGPRGRCALRQAVTPFPMPRRRRDGGFEGPQNGEETRSWEREVSPRHQTKNRHRTCTPLNRPFSFYGSERPKLKQGASKERAGAASTFLKRGSRI